MKTYISLLLAASLAAPVLRAGADTLRVQSQVDAVTVFFSGAMVDRQAVVKLQRGKQVVCFTDLPLSLKPQTVQLTGLKQATILVVKHAVETPARSDNPDRRKELQAEEKALVRRNDGLKAEIAILKQEEEILLKNAHIAGDNGVKVEALRETADFYRQRLGEIRKLMFAHQFAIELNQETLRQLYQQMNALLGPEPKPQGVVYVTLEGRREHADTLRLRYYDEAAGWQPTYDFRVEDLRKPLQISYLAEVFQYSGEAWKQVKLTLSTANPSLSGDKPQLRPWYFGMREQSVERKFDYVQGSGSSIRGKLLDEAKREGIPFGNIVLFLNDQQVGGTTTDVDGNFKFNHLKPGVYTLKASYAGFNPIQLNRIIVTDSKLTVANLHMSSGVNLKEVVVADYEKPLISKDEANFRGTSREEIAALPTRDVNSIASTSMGVFSDTYGEEVLHIRGSSSIRSDYFIDGIRTRGSTLDPSTLLPRSPELLQYVIENRQTIPTDGEKQRVPIKDVEAPARYVHQAVPKLSNDVFLTAELSPWAYLNLLDGKASLYYQGTFVGETEVRTQSTGDTLRLALGRDRGLVIERKLVLDQESRKVVGSSIRQQLQWEINIRNQKDYAVVLQVQEQLPLSKSRSVEISYEALPAAAYDESSGELLWKINLPGGEKTSLKLNYQVKYPANYSF